MGSEMCIRDRCGSYLRNIYTSDAGTLKYKNFFSGFTPEQELKYHRWLNYILIRESFSKNSNDERLQFWSQYVPYSTDAYRVSASECLVIEFEMYSIIEFTTKTMGPLYIYRKDIFEKFVKKYLKRMNNTELRHSLYNELLQYATERIIHHDNWQYKTSRYLMAHSIIS